MSSIAPPNYTQVPNFLLALLPVMTDAEIRVVMAIVRETFGWHREKIKLSTTDLMRLTQLSREGVKLGVKAGLQRGILVREPLGQSFEYRLNVQEPGNEVAQSEEETIQPGNQVAQLDDSTRQRSSLALGNQVAYLEDSTGQPSSLVPGNQVAPPCKEKRNLKKELKKQQQTKGEVVVVVEDYSEAEILAYAQAQANIENPVGFTKSVLEGTAKDLPRILQSIGEWLRDHAPPESDHADSAEIAMPGEPVPELLAELLTAISERVNPTTFQTWFAPVRAMSRGDTTVSLLVPDASFAGWIGNRYSEIVLEALAQVGLVGYGVEFVIKRE